jgi:hypothetical protein
MNKIKVAIILLIIAVVAGVSYYFYTYRPYFYTGPDSVPEEEKFARESENVEFVGYVFVQNFMKSAPPQPDSQATQDAYDALSVNAKTKVSSDSISRDLASFMGVQDIPNQGFSIEDLQFEGLEKAKYIVGLNYSGGRVLRSINLIQEDGIWKVDSVNSLEQYP